MRLGVSDRRVLEAFVDRRKLEGVKLYSDGKSLNAYGLGGARIAYWEGGRIHMGYAGDRTRQSLQRAVRRHAAPAQLADWTGKFTRAGRPTFRDRRRRRRTRRW